MAKPAGLRYRAVQSPYGKSPSPLRPPDVWITPSSEMCSKTRSFRMSGLPRRRWRVAHQPDLALAAPDHAQEPLGPLDRLGFRRHLDDREARHELLRFG